MPLNIKDAEDALMTTEARFNDWMGEFDTEWNLPFTEMQVTMMLASAPPQVLTELYKRVPQAMEYLAKRIEDRKVKNAS